MDKKIDTLFKSAFAVLFSIIGYFLVDAHKQINDLRKAKALQEIKTAVLESRSTQDREMYREIKTDLKVIREQQNELMTRIAQLSSN